MNWYLDWFDGFSWQLYDQITAESFGGRAEKLRTNNSAAYERASSINNRSVTQYLYASTILWSSFDPSFNASRSCSEKTCLSPILPPNKDSQKDLFSPAKNISPITLRNGDGGIQPGELPKNRTMLCTLHDSYRMVAISVLISILWYNERLFHKYQNPPLFRPPILHFYIFVHHR